MKIQQGEEGVEGGPSAAAAASHPRQSGNMRGRVGGGGFTRGGRS